DRTAARPDRCVAHASEPASLPARAMASATPRYVAHRPAHRIGGISRFARRRSLSATVQRSIEATKIEATKDDAVQKEVRAQPNLPGARFAADPMYHAPQGRATCEPITGAP